MNFQIYGMAWDMILYFFLVFKEQRLQKSTGHSYEFLNGLDFRLSQRLANWAIILSAVLPVIKNLP